VFVLTVMIETNSLCKNYNMGEIEMEILKDINLRIFKGEFISIMGPSGSGKSTLLYLLGSLDKSSSGSVKINGRELSIMKDKEESILRRKEIGFVFQFYNLVPNLTVEENIMLPILLDGKRMKHYRKEIDEMLDIVGLVDRRTHTPRELSGGQQQRVAIARALINDPDVILADEPIGNLDSTTGGEIMELLQKINLEKNKTVVQVTHSESSADFGTKIIRLKDGRIV